MSSGTQEADTALEEGPRKVTTRRARVRGPRRNRHVLPSQMLTYFPELGMCEAQAIPTKRPKRNKGSLSKSMRLSSQFTSQWEEPSGALAQLIFWVTLVHIFLGFV